MRQSLQTSRQMPATTSSRMASTIAVRFPALMHHVEQLLTPYLTPQFASKSPGPRRHDTLALVRFIFLCPRFLVLTDFLLLLMAAIPPPSTNRDCRPYRDIPGLPAQSSTGSRVWYCHWPASAPLSASKEKCGVGSGCRGMGQKFGEGRASAVVPVRRKGALCTKICRCLSWSLLYATCF